MIRQFDVVPNPFPGAARNRPFLVCVQHYGLDHLGTRITAPLVVEEFAGKATRLNPRFDIGGKNLYLVPHDLVTLALRQLGKPVANLESERDKIVAALDLVFTGV